VNEEVDEVAVWRLAQGDRSIPLYRRRKGSRGGRLLSPEAVEAIRSMAASGLSDRLIGERLGRSRDAICQARRRYGIPAARPRKGAA
jgi:hypothetical protein